MTLIQDALPDKTAVLAWPWPGIVYARYPYKLGWYKHGIFYYDITISEWRS